MYTPDKFQREIKGNRGLFVCNICGSISAMDNGSFHAGCRHVDLVIDEDTIVVSPIGMCS